MNGNLALSFLFCSLKLEFFYISCSISIRHFISIAHNVSVLFVKRY